MTYPITALRVVCIVEGTIGCLLNLIVIFLLKRSRLDALFRISIGIWSLGNFMLSLLIATLQFIHVFLDCHFIFVIFNPFIGQVSKEIFNVLTMLASALCSSMFIFIPTLGGLQLIALTKPHWNSKKKFVAAFAHPLICAIVVCIAVPQLVPTPALDREMERVARAKFSIDDHLLFYRYGGTMNRTELNDGRHFLVALFGFIIFPYTTSYTEMVILMVMIYKHLKSYQSAIVSTRTAKLQNDFFIMQLVQSILPMIMLSAPFFSLVVGGITCVESDWSTISLTSIAWACPVVQASVQIYYVRRSCIRSPDASKASTKTGVSSRNDSQRLS